MVRVLFILTFACLMSFQTNAQTIPFNNGVKLKADSLYSIGMKLFQNDSLISGYEHLRAFKELNRSLLTTYRKFLDDLDSLTKHKPIKPIVIESNRIQGSKIKNNKDSIMQIM